MVGSWWGGRTAGPVETGPGAGTEEWSGAGLLRSLEWRLAEGSLGQRAQAMLEIREAMAGCPTPALVSGVLLRLADAFKTAEGPTRDMVLEAVGRVGPQGWASVAALSSADQVCDRVFAVSYSNDAGARAAALLLLGQLGALWPERKDVHHLVSVSTASADPRELSAALTAAARLATLSPQFCREMYSRLAEMVSAPGTKTPTKVTLLKDILSEFFADAATAKRVVGLCEGLLENGARGPIPAAALQCLARLALRARAVFPAALRPLIRASQHSPTALRLLRSLARDAPAAWPAKDVRSLASLAFASTQPDQALRVLLLLSQRPTARLWVSAEVLKGLEGLAGAEKDETALLGLATLANLVQRMSSEEAKSSGLMDRLRQWAAALLLSVREPALLKLLSYATVQVSQTSGTTCATLVAIVQQRMAQPDVDESTAELWVTTLEAMCSAHVSVQEEVQSWARGLPKGSPGRRLLIGPKPLNREMGSSPDDWDWEADAGALDLWAKFRLARRALKAGRSEVAEPVLSQLSCLLSEAKFRHYLRCLELCAKADGVLAQLGDGGRSEVLSGLGTAASLLKEAETAAELGASEGWEGGALAKGWVQARAHWLDAVSGVLVAWGARALAGSEGRLVGQLSGAAQELRRAAEDWEALAERAFDADDSALEELALQAHVPAAFYRAVLLALGANARPLCAPPPCRTNLPLTAQLAWVGESVEALPATKDPESGLWAKMEAVLGLMRRTLSLPTFYPTSLFRLPQTTSLKVWLRGEGLGGEAEEGRMEVAEGRDAVVRVHGLLSQRWPEGAEGPRRRVAQVELSVAVEPVEEGGWESGKRGPERLLRLSRSAELQGDFFASEFLLPVRVSSVATLSVAFVEATGHSKPWPTHHTATLRINVNSLHQ